MRVEGGRRKAVAAAVLAALAGLSWLTMEPGRPRWLVLILLAGFALRILLAGSGSDSRAGGGSLYDRIDGG
jgi:hypothetical protein